VDQISTADLLNLVLAQRASIDMQFQFWLTITFSVIVASFIAGPRLVPKLRALTAVLYLLASAHLATRWFFDGLTARHWLKILASRGAEFEIPWIAAYLRMAVMVLGTAGALVFLFWHSRERQDAG
jgi:hypothetical protein